MQDTLFHDASLDSSINEAFLQLQCIMTWGKCGDSRFIHYTTHVTPNYKTIFFTEHENYINWYILLASIRPIASMQLSSYALRCERGHWGTNGVVNYAHIALNKFKSLSITLWHNALPLIIFDHAFHTSSTKPNPCTNFSHNHNVHSRLQLSLAKFLSIVSRYSPSHISRDM